MWDALRCSETSGSNCPGRSSCPARQPLQVYLLPLLVEYRCSALSQLGKGRLPAPERAPKDTPLVHPLTRMVKRIRNPPRSGGGQAGFAQRAGDQTSAGELPAPTKCKGDPLSFPLRPLPTARRARRLRTS